MSKEKISILIVDDEEMIVDEFLFFLEQFGYNVQGLTDSKVAVEKIKKEKFDIVVTDLKMPEVSGMDIAKTVKQYSPETLTFIITGFATVDSVIEAIQHGVYDYIRKPFKFKEIKIGIERAVEQILLKRENRILNQKIQQMLSYITTLYDISSILYQITDFSLVQEMIIDTITEGLNISKSAIFIKENNEFQIKKHHGLDASFIEKCRLTDDSTINEYEISDIHSTIIENIQGNIVVDGQVVEISDGIDYFILTPITFHSKVLGFIAVFSHSEESLQLEDELKLINIIATQAAPIFQKKYATKSDDSDKIKKVHPVVESAMEQYIFNADKRNGSVSFAKGRIVRKKTVPSHKGITEITAQFNHIITAKIEEKVVVYWQTFDSFLLIVPDSNPASCEMVLSNIKSNFENVISDVDGNTAYFLQYVSLSYPYEKGTPEILLEKLGEKMFANLNTLED
ncbi:MAG: response regulator [Candidatus Marinimicrobia bacterium]|nr:response regulator [Candidatus Neomarinimicrobiota bacterium]